MTPLWRSYWDGCSRAPLRIGVASIAALELGVECYQVAWQSGDPERYPPSGALSRALADVPGAAWLVLAMILVGLVAVARDRSPVAGGLWALGWAALLSEWQTQIFGSPSRNAFFPGAALLGWVLGQLWAGFIAEREPSDPRDRDPASHRALRERLGEAGVLGCLAAAYVGSCLSKLLSSGASWSDASQVRALVLWQEPLADWSWLLAYRDAILHDPSFARLAAVATLVIEGGAFLLLFGPRLRLGWGALIFALHTNIIVLCTMPYLEPMALLVLFVVPWPRIMGATAHAHLGSGVRDRPALPWPMALALACVMSFAWAVAPWGWRGH